MLLQGVMLLWFIEVLLSVVFVAIDIRNTPEASVMKWAFVIVTLFMGPLGLFLYLIACREPLPDTHAEYVRARWRQVVGSTMHCVAGDGIGILVGAAIFSSLGAPAWLEMIGEYTLGFLFGWTVFQALFMKNMAGGSYARSLKTTFLPEFVSMNGLMGGMMALSMPWRHALGHHAMPDRPEFWFVMSLGLTLGFLVAYPLNWWLVSAHLKHGMMTVPSRRRALVGAAASGAGMASGMSMDHVGSGPRGSGDGAAVQTSPESEAPASTATKVWMIVVSLLILAAGLTIAFVFMA